MHIRLDGGDLHDARHAWCGNSQDGRCAVREPGGAYLHLTREGVPAYDARWRHAGDFRDGIAVVQADDGRSTHVDPLGTQIHGVWFLDLDVFHKGFAHARDEDGRMHVDRMLSRCAAWVTHLSVPTRGTEDRAPYGPVFEAVRHEEPGIHKNRASIQGKAAR